MTKKEALRIVRAAMRARESGTKEDPALHKACRIVIALTNAPRPVQFFALSMLRATSPRPHQGGGAKENER